MVGTTLDFRTILTPDNLGTEIAKKWVEWRSLSQAARSEWEEIRKHVFATDTKQMISESSLPWKNTTAIPKLCHVSDNLHANYMAALFPKRKWMTWEANNEDANSKRKRDAILNYMYWAVSQPMFKETVGKLVKDFIHEGNCFAMPEWYDGRDKEDAGTERAGYVGPILKRISPYDIVFNPTATHFQDSPKIVRSLVQIGEVKRILEAETTDGNRDEMKALWNYLIEYRSTFHNSTVDCQEMDASYQVDGFSNFTNYLVSDHVEILTFYGDIFDWNKKELLQNYQIMVVDRHKVIGKKPNPSYFGRPPIFHAGWRIRPDNLWAMSPLANLVGMQYRINHIENMKSDVLDLITVPVIVEKGYVEDFIWQPGERIRTGDDGEVEMLAPPFQVLQLNSELNSYETKIELFAGSPREAMGFRTPGEKTAFEVSRLENAAARIFQNKTLYLEEQFIERCLNGMLELAKRLVTGPQSINVFDDEFKFQDFQTLTADDITGAGRLKPIAARHFVEQAELVQNLGNVHQIIAQDPLLMAHFSSVQMAKIYEDALNLHDYKVIQPFIRVSEQAEAQQQQQVAHENTTMAAMQPSGMTPDDHDHPEISAQMMGPKAPPELPPTMVGSGLPDEFGEMSGPSSKSK